MPLFGKSTKSPAELVKALKEAVNSLERGDKKAEKAQEDVSKNLVRIKLCLFINTKTSNDLFPLFINIYEIFFFFVGVVTI